MSQTNQATRYLTTSVVYRAIGRRMRRHGIGRPRHVQIGRWDARSCLTWHHVAVDALNRAAIARRQGRLDQARVQIDLARLAVEKAAGALS